MNSSTRYKSSKFSNLGCADLVAMAERELSAFFKVVTQSFGPEQAQLSAEEWLHELTEIDGLPSSVREWRLITAKASTRLPSGVNA